ncbi:DUF5658 family protein [Bradyrhizobium sp. C-145]|uniref:DUF5658 family protein n=1 Tax=Bradyrhizobium sp. C-145 TaxID=574727 RepID=UPI00201B4BB7|nr:DUF5658 family protein [Bradyrhizobium sp. C-145]UQR61093.1 DUF5658 family protein [Bradyrhizobium sp. C-145]
MLILVGTALCCGIEIDIFELIAMKVWIYTDRSRVVGDPGHLKVFETIEAARAWFEHNEPEGVAFEYETVAAQRSNRPLKQSSGTNPNARRIKALLVLFILFLGCADLVTTNIILNLGLGELNPFMHVAQTWLGAWWLIPKLGLTYIMMWLLWRSTNPYNVAMVAAFCCAPVLNNLLIIAGTA